MMNYIATQLVAFFCVVWESPKGSGQIGIINQQTELGWLPVIGGQRYLLNILVVAVLTVVMYIYLNYSKHGYEIAVVGESERTARYVGIKVERVIIRTMLLSGGLCGLAGMLLVGGTDHTLTTTITGGPRLHGGHGVVAGEVQPHLDDPDLLPAGVFAARRGRDLHVLRAEPVLLGHPDGHHPVLHHRQRVLHQLQDQLPPRGKKEG